MNTAKLKIFSAEARKKLMRGVCHRLEALGFDLGTGETQTTPIQFEGGAVFQDTTVSTKFFDQWTSLFKNINSRGIRAVAEEAAYTWFNRLMAIRIMSKQEFISPVLEYEDETVHVPIIVAEARQGRLPDMTDEERTRLMGIIDDDSRTAEQFAILIVAYCHSNAIINRCFGAIADYTELLLPQDILADSGFVDMINNSTFITDEQYASAELIGWLYQFYISDRKDEAFAKSGKYNADDIAPATQIFTPNWIVKYMVQNTVGRICLDNGLADSEEDNWKYLVQNDTQGNTLDVTDLTELKVADLACGSGHILNECFELLYKLYIDNGYSRLDAVKNIFAKNLIGIDLDTRAKQLATFSLLMKACKCDKSFADAHIMPRIFDMPRPIAEVMPDYFHNANDEKSLKESIGALFHHYLMGATKQMQQELGEAVMLINHADTLGSIMKFDLSVTTRNALMVRTAEYEEMLSSGDYVPEPNRIAMRYAHIILALTEEYSAICMNPPYMGSGRFDSTLSKYVKDNYAEGKADLFAVFMQVAINRLAAGGKYGMINMHSWMFLSSFQGLRNTVLKEQTIDSLLHLGARTFDELSGEVVQNAAFVISNNKPFKQFSQFNEKTGCEEIIRQNNASASYFRLVDGRDCADKERMFLDALDNNTEGLYFPKVAQDNFEKIPGSPIGYWVSEKVFDDFSFPKLRSLGEPRSGIMTGNSSRFVKLFFEVSQNSIGYNLTKASDIVLTGKTWFPVVTGGGARKWYGNLDSIVNLYNNGEQIKATVKNFRLREPKYYFRPSITWPKISSENTTFRFCPQGVLFGDSGLNLFIEGEFTAYLGLLNSKIMRFILKVINPTLNNQVSDIGSVPISPELSSKNSLVEECVDISREDWDAHETSWDFKANELVANASENSKISEVLNASISNWFDKFQQLHANEVELNRQFIGIYGLQDELTPDVPLNEVTILQQGEISIEPYNGGTLPEEPVAGYHARFSNNKSCRFATCPEIVWHYDVFIKQFISYAVGCMMGRYSIDKPGLILANQGDGIDQYDELVPNSRFEVDDDGVIPLMPSDTWFNDNATLRFKRFVATVFGEASLNENLNFIEQALGKNIDTYFVKDFWKDHKKMYQNRPIYWLFSSKNGAFQCLAYMHRMDAYTAERIRSKYLLPHIEWLVGKAQELENAPLLNTQERRELDTLRKQIDECREYHDRLHDVADKQIAFDLDDGVVVNYAKFGDVLQKIR